VGVNILGLAREGVVDGAELVLDELGAVLEGAVAVVVGEGDLDGLATLDLLSEQVGFVQEKDHGSVSEPLALADLVEELQKK